jgi:hypothetical protein
MRDIVNTLHDLARRGVTVRSLHDGVDLSTSTGRMVAGILMSIARYEAELAAFALIGAPEQAPAFAGRGPGKRTA